MSEKENAPQTQQAEQAIDPAKIRRANAGNILKKLRAGKTLSAQERNALEEFQSEQSGGWVKDTSALARTPTPARASQRSAIVPSAAGPTRHNSR